MQSIQTMRFYQIPITAAEHKGRCSRTLDIISYVCLSYCKYNYNGKQGKINNVYKGTSAMEYQGAKLCLIQTAMLNTKARYVGCQGRTALGIPLFILN